VIVQHLTTIVFLYQKHHPKDCWITDRNMLVKTVYVIKLKCICWLFYTSH